MRHGRMLLSNRAAAHLQSFFRTDEKFFQYKTTIFIPRSRQARHPLYQRFFLWFSKSSPRGILLYSLACLQKFNIFFKVLLVQESMATVSLLSVVLSAEEFQTLNDNVRLKLEDLLKKHESDSNQQKIQYAKLQTQSG